MKLEHPDLFVNRHIGPAEDDVRKMLAVVGLRSLEELTAQTVPEAIRLGGSLDLPPPLSEQALLLELAGIASRNRIFHSYLGMGYSDCITPPVILRNIPPFGSSSDQCAEL